MNNYATCPYCNRALFIDDCIDNRYNAKEITSHWIGRCLKCGKNFRWKEVYLFDRIEDLVEVE